MVISTLLLALLSNPLLAAEPASPPPAQAVSAAGLTVTADLRSEYLAGFPMLVSVTVTNPGTAPATFPDLRSRPHLVHFVVSGPKGTSERFTTPPAKDPGTTWSVPAGSSQRVLLEVPSSAAFGPGAYTLKVKVGDPAGMIDLPAHNLSIRAPVPVAGTPVWEPTIATNVGAMFPWLHQAADGFDLYLMQFDPRAPTRVVAQYALTHLAAKVEPILARARQSEAQARHVYWLSNGNQLSVGRIDVSRLDGAPRTYSLPYPKVELLDRGATDAKGGLTVPIWIPNPTGTGGKVRAWTISSRGEQGVRDVGTYPTRPAVVATAVDAGASLVLALGHEAGVDLFRVNPDAAAEMPALGKRIWKSELGWTVRRLAFDVLPDAAGKPGGLSLLTLLTRTNGTAATHRSLWTDLSGTVLADGGELPWVFQGDVVDLLPAAYGPFVVLTHNGATWTWGAENGPAAPAAVNGTPMLWGAGDAVSLRTMGGPTVTRDAVLGTIPK